MENSAILSFILKFCEKLQLYYSYSGLNKLAKSTGNTMHRLCLGSGIGNFFAKRWKTDTAWKNSFIIALLLFPIRLIRKVSVKTAALMKGHVEDSSLLNGTVNLLDSILVISTRVYGLFLLAFTLTEGILWLAFKAFILKYLLLRAALLVLAVLLVLVNRPLKVLFTGSFIGKLIINFFVIRGIEDGTIDK